MKVRRVQPHEGALYRKLRLNMLLESPAAFGDSFAHAQNLPDSYWAEMAEHSASSAENVIFIAFDGNHPCGAVSGMLIAPPVLSDQQTAVLSRAARGTPPTPEEAECLGPQLRAAALRLSERQWHDPHEAFDMLQHTGLKMGDIFRIMPPPRKPNEPDDMPPPPPPGGGPFGGRITSTSGMISGMWVDPTYRHRGIGQALMAAVIDWARAQGAERLELGVVEGNAPAIHLYERFGFKEVSRPMPAPPGETRRFRFTVRTL
jgi:GNAT superfamily N-acetyltransferase